MLCPSCKHENRAGRRFCVHCGARLALVCASCKAENAPGEQFCGDCGQRIAEPMQARPLPGPLSYMRISNEDHRCPSGLADASLRWAGR
jgi:Double zinc ribbon